MELAPQAGFEPNPPVNSNHGAWAPSLNTETCGDYSLMQS